MLRTCKPFRSERGMKCQLRRFSESNSIVVWRRCSSVNVSRKASAWDDMVWAVDARNVFQPPASAAVRTRRSTSEMRCMVGISDERGAKVQSAGTDTLIETGGERLVLVGERLRAPFSTDARVV